MVTMVWVDGRLVCGRAGLARKHSGLIQAHCAPRRFGCLLSSPVGAHECRGTSRSASTPTRSLEPFWVKLLYFPSEGRHAEDFYA
jgi:hypothetical protein